MIRLFRVTVLLIAFFTLVMIPGLVNRPSLSLLALLFYRADGSSCSDPCLFGVSHLEDLSHADIVARLRQSPLLYGMGWTFSEGTTDSHMVWPDMAIAVLQNDEIAMHWATFSTDGRVVNSFFSRLWNEATLDRTIQDLGIPDHVIFFACYTAQKTLMLFYPDRHLRMTFSIESEHDVRPDEKLVSIQFEADGNISPSRIVAPHSTGIERLQRWAGYGDSDLTRPPC